MPVVNNAMPGGMLAARPLAEVDGASQALAHCCSRQPTRSLTHAFPVPNPSLPPDGACARRGFFVSFAIQESLKCTLASWALG